MSQKVKTTTTTTESTTILTNENSTSTLDQQQQQQQQQTEYCNNAQKILNIHIDTTASIEVCYEQIQQIVGILCPFLLLPYSDKIDNNDNDRRFEIKPLTGGLSNKLFLVSSSNFITDTDTTPGTTIVGTVLVRIHPDNNNNATTSNNDTNINTNTNNSDHKENSHESNNFSIVDREQEPKFATWLAKQQQRSSSHDVVQDDEKKDDNNNSNMNMAPTVYGRFINGRVEEFYENVVPLSCSQMKVYAPWIAQNLASFHQLDTPPKDVLPRPSTNYDATIYESIHGWLKEAKTTVDAGNIADADQDLLKELCEEWEWLEKELTTPPPQYHQSQSLSSDESNNHNHNNHIIVKEALEFIRRVVVTHMDCQPLNILIDENDKNIPPSTNLRLIDFEYYGWNPIVSLFFFSPLACI